MSHVAKLIFAVSASILSFSGAYGNDDLNILWKPQKHQFAYCEKLDSPASEALANKLVHYKGDVSEVLAKHLLAVPTNQVHDELESIWNRVENIETKEYWDNLTKVALTVSFKKTYLPDALQLICRIANGNKSPEDTGYLRFYYAGQISGNAYSDAPVVSLDVKGACIPEVIGKIVLQTGPVFRAESNIVCVGSNIHNVPTLWENPAWSSVIMEISITPKKSFMFTKKWDPSVMIKQGSVKKYLNPMFGGLLNNLDIAAYDVDRQRLVVIANADVANGFLDLLGNR